MLISTKGRYALRAMIDLAEHQAEGYIPLKEIAARQEISDKYLESIVKQLVKAKLVVGIRGKGGGYKLNADPTSITAYQVLEVAEGSLSPVENLEGDHPELGRVSQYKTLEMWRELDRLIKDYLGSKTVSDLCDTTNAADYYVI